MIFAPVLTIAFALPAAEQPLDVREPPFSEDFTWMNGSNTQPPSLVVMGPITWSFYVDTYYAWQFQQPIDHTIFPATTAPRHNEISLNLAHLGLDVTGLDGPTGRFYIQYGSIVETIAGQDTTTTRGFFLTNRLLQYVEQAAVGWHFHWMHGANAEVGIFPSYVGLESYLPEENWSYTHAFISDATPYYFFGFRGQLFPSARFKLELWIVNGWQTFGQWHETRAGGYQWNWRPTEWLSLVNSLYVGREAEGDPRSLRVFSDNNVQVRYLKRERGFLRSAAISLVADVGHEHRSDGPSGWMGGATLTHHWEWTQRWKSALRFDVIHDATQAITPRFPVGAAYLWAGTNPMFAGGLTATMDYWPSPWFLIRLEYAHRIANQPLFTGHGGITGPGGRLPKDATSAAAFTPDLSKSDDRLVFNMTLRL